ncbi:RagB/SusD family nutrient uptake outer membrane protein [Niabella sp.]|uniref:RagB/SusD family nutrient uptake outer membrane protein n=1 Tax=Niabella sp. TaxID=1962976 RepID=UPI002636A2CE|nr:RagB/SusD family nutrient uptake outer membrane protein [Niabella sp.]
MKTTKYWAVLLIISGALFAACNKGFLDRAATTQQQDKDIFTLFSQTDMVINNLYSKLPKVYGYLQGYQMSSATDEAKDASNWMASMRFNSGSLSPTDNPIGNTWRDYYVMIRQANSILEGIAKYNTPDNPNRAGDLKNRIGEVYFLRAWALFELVRQFGGVIIVNNVIQDPNDDAALKRPRNSYDSCVAQIAADCDMAYARVQTATYQPQDFGRVTKAACLALKSRIYLYSASPLWAQTGKTTPFPDVSENTIASDPAKWKIAADAAKAAIDYCATAGYKLEPNLTSRKNMYIQPWNSPEVLWVRMNEEGGSEFERHYFPFGYSGWSAAAPTQNVVDDYEMKDGTPIATSSLYKEATPYVDRDPRFYTDILYNGAQFKGRAVETFAGGRDEASTNTDHSRTGYYQRKLVDEGQTVGQTSRTTDGIKFRLSELYLNYAEALNEYAPGNADIAQYVNAIRSRAGMPELPAGLTQDQMRTRIRNERRVELFAENQRFWDVRRWKIASQTEQNIWGMRAIKEGSGFKYERFLVEKRPWRNAMLVIPVTLDETFRNPNLKQNPGW